MRRTPEHARLGYGDTAGDPRLRTAIAAYVTAATWRQVFTGAGRPRRGRTSRAGPLRAPAARPRGSGVDRGAGICRRAGRAARRGRSHRAGPGRRGRLDVAAGEARCPGARLAYITPSCQFPLGATLSLERRLRLLDWAERAGAFVIEDDYDSEYRYRGRPITALRDRYQRPGRLRRHVFEDDVSRAACRLHHRARGTGGGLRPRGQKHRPVRAATGAGGTRRVHRRRPLRQARAPDADAVRKASRVPLGAGPRTSVGCDGARPLRSRHASRRLARRWTG